MNYIDTEKLKEDISRAVEKAEQKTGDYKAMAAQRYSQMKDMAQMKREKIKKYVEENPEKAVLMAAGAGLIAGVILTGVMKNKKKWCRHCMDKWKH